MNGINQLVRLFHINYILVKHGLDEIILTTHLFRPLRFLNYISPWRWVHRSRQPRAVRIRRALEDLGPIFVKFGQILSTRRDLLPDDIAVELAKLQDQVPSFPTQQAIDIIEKAYGRIISDVFEHFEEEPLASASIAQVYCARLKDGSEVVVKVVRPGIKAIINRDIQLLYTIAKLAERYWKDGRRLRPVEVVTEYKKTILDELDLMREAASASQLRRNFADSDKLYVPEIHWPLTRSNVLVMEKVSGIPISNIKALVKAKIDLKQLAENGVEIFFTQVFRDSFFHADMHPGNIFVSEKGKYIAIDFGIMGTLGPEDQQYLAGNFLAFFRRDYRRVAELHVESKWVPEGTRVDEFESAIRTVCEPIFERPLKDISFGHLLLRLFQTASRFNMQVQPQLVLLQKTLLNIEGLGRQLYPELDLWQTAKPYLERWMSEQIGFRSLIRGLKDSAPLWAEQIPQLPSLIHGVLVDVKNGKQRRDSINKQQLQKLQKEIRHANHRIFRAIVGSGLIISAMIVLKLDAKASMVITDIPLLTWIFASIGTLIIVFSWTSKSN